MKTRSRTPRWPLWSVLWRTLVFGPILWPLGVLALVGVLASMVSTPIYACVLVIEEHYFFASVVLLAWVFWLRHGFRLLRWMLQGSEYSSL